MSPAMALVDYSDSESDEDTHSELPHKPQPTLKRKRVEEGIESKPDPASALPPLPAAFHDLYATNARVSVRDDPNLHGGRKRVTPHVEGNWPTHVYLEWYPKPTELKDLSALIAKAGESTTSGDEGLHSLLHSDLGAQLPLHISLSRPVVLLTNQRQPFHDAFERAVVKSNIRPFDVTVTGLDWVSNFEGSCWFLVMRVSKPNYDGLNKLLRLSNEALAAFGQRPLYGEGEPKRNGSARGQGHSRGRGRGLSTSRTDKQGTDERLVDCSSHFHTSIAWRLDEPTGEGKGKTASIDLRAMNNTTIHFSSVKVKVGNAVNSIPLPIGTIDESGFGGL